MEPSDSKIGRGCSKNCKIVWGFSYVYDVVLNDSIPFGWIRLGPGYGQTVVSGVCLQDIIRMTSWCCR